MTGGAASCALLVQVREVIRDHSGFDAVETEAEREAMWSEYCAELKKEVDEEERAKKGKGSHAATKKDDAKDDRDKKARKKDRDDDADEAR